MDNEKFLDDVVKFLIENCNKSQMETLIVVGDLNLDFNVEQNKKYLEFFKQHFELEPFFFNSNTFYNVSQLDWCLDNKRNKFKMFKSQPFSIWFSDH